MERVIVARITIPNYLRDINLSEKQREKYYEWDGKTIKSGSKKLLQKYINPDYKKAIIVNEGNVKPQHLKAEYTIVGFKGNKIYNRYYRFTNGFGVIASLTDKQLKKEVKYFLCKTEINNFIKVIANETQAGKPRRHIIKGQDFYVGLNPHLRNKVVSKLKDSYWEKFQLLSDEVIQNIRDRVNVHFPLMIEMEIQDTIKNEYDRSKTGHGIRWDVGNRAEPYMKTFLDFLVNGYTVNETVVLESIIPDDDRLHISSGNNAIFTPIEEGETRKLVFTIYRDTRLIWKNFL